MNFVMQRVPLGRFLSIAVFIWGAHVMLIAVCHNWAGLMVLRTIIGGFEYVYHTCRMSIVHLTLQIMHLARVSYDRCLVVSTRRAWHAIDDLDGSERFLR